MIYLVYKLLILIKLVSLILRAKFCREDFVHYASTCFQEFGDRVKHWITVNEPHNFAIDGYDFGIQAPGRCSILSHLFCKDGKSSTEPYLVAHNILLAHAGVFHTYKQYFKVIYL
jgi:beta-glucosidase